MWIIALMAIFMLSTIFVDYENYVVVLVVVGGAAWLLLTIITDRQERKLYEELDDLTDDEYEGFLDDAEEQGLAKRDRSQQD